MKMPQEFIDAINEAVKAINPDAGEMVSGSFTLGKDFDEWLGPEALLKFGLGPLPPEELERFNAKFAEKKEKIKTALIESAVRVEKQRMAGTLEPFSFNDSHRTAHHSDTKKG